MQFFIHANSSIFYFIIFFFSQTAEGDINEVLIKTLAEAHANTNLKLDVVHEMFRKPQVSQEHSIPPKGLFNWRFFIEYNNELCV